MASSSTFPYVMMAVVVDGKYGSELQKEKRNEEKILGFGVLSFSGQGLVDRSFRARTRGGGVVGCQFSQQPPHQGPLPYDCSAGKHE